MFFVTTTSFHEENKQTCKLHCFKYLLCLLICIKRYTLLLTKIKQNLVPHNYFFVKLVHYTYLTLTSLAFCLAKNAVSALSSFLALFFSLFILWSNLSISFLSFVPPCFFWKGSKLEKRNPKDFTSDGIQRQEVTRWIVREIRFSDRY